MTMGRGGPHTVLWLLAGFTRCPLLYLARGDLMAPAAKAHTCWNSVYSCHHHSPGHLSPSCILHPALPQLVTPQFPRLPGSNPSAISPIPDSQELLDLSQAMHIHDTVPSTGDKLRWDTMQKSEDLNPPPVHYTYIASYTCHVHSVWNNKPFLGTYSVPGTVLRVWVPQLTSDTHQVPADTGKGKQIIMHLCKLIPGSCWKVYN